MALETLEHFTINCADMEKTRDFYRDVLGLEEGFRPPFRFAGHWMYCGGVPVVHILGRDGALPENSAVALGGSTGSLDHVAFRASGAGAMKANLEKHGVAYRENVVPGSRLLQLFVRDPDGIMVEMNFRGEG